jgi:hypothetical protein
MLHDLARSTLSHLNVEGFSIFILFNLAGAKWSAFSKLASKKFPFGM